MRRTLLIDATVLHMVPSPEALRVKFDQKMRKRGTSIRESDEPLVARADHGRWVADCPACAAGIALTPGVAEGLCFGAGCGHRFTAIAWPPAETVEEIERALRARPKLQTRNWLPSEAVADLQRENREHGLQARHETQAESHARGAQKGKV